MSALGMSAIRRIVHEVRSVEIGATTRYERHQLVVDRDQAEALFAKEHRWVFPRRDMRLMPKHPTDWFRPVASVDQSALTGWNQPRPTTSNQQRTFA